MSDDKKGVALSKEEIDALAKKYYLLPDDVYFRSNVNPHNIRAFARAILSRASSSRADGQEGWQLVPKEATTDMLVAGINANIPLICDQGSAMGKAYRAMLAAAEAPNANTKEA